MSPDLLGCAKDRRERYIEKLGEAVALLPSAHGVVRSADSEFPFRQDSDFHYLTGLDEPDCVALLRPQSEQRFVLFVRPRDRDAEVWTGRRTGVEGATGIYGADVAYPMTELDARLPELLLDVDVLQYALGCDPSMDARVVRLLAEHRRTRPRRGRGLVRIDDPSPLLHEMRLFKDAYELDRMRTAAAISTEAHVRIMQEARPGMREFELQARLENDFRRRGSSGPAYGSIVGGGANATILHYVENRDELREGDLVLVDAGCEYEGYAADITRTWPVGPGFSPAQTDIYNVVLEAQKQAIEEVQPGARFIDAHDRAVEVLCDGLVDLGLVEGPPDRARESGDYRKYYMHRTSHWLGLDVHDVGLYESGGASRLLEPGMVLTVEPGIYVAADDPNAPERYRGIGVRIEDDVLVTPTGHDVLTCDVPKEREAVEALRAGVLGRAS
jgi:Xaa-Pro aminopeptidase